MFLFGSSVDHSFLKSLAELEGPISAICRVSFVLILLSHIPYFFFAMKEFLLVIYDEAKNRSMS